MATEIQMKITAIEHRGLMRVAQELVEGDEGIEFDAITLLLRASLANLHLLRPHIESLRAYCKREGLNEVSVWQDMIKRQSAMKPGRKPRRRKR